MTENYEKLLNPDSGKANVVAMDHGMASMVFDEFKNPGKTLEQVLAGEPDAVLISPMLVRRFASLFEKHPTVRKIATLDALTLPELSGPLPVFDIDAALDSGADAIKSLLIFGQADRRDYLDNVSYVAALAELAQQRGVPFMVEAVLWGPEITTEKRNDPELINKACRVAFELGADVIKTEYTGDAASFSDIAASYPIPIMVLGGSKTGLADLFKRVKESMGAGARGVVIGRNVFQQERPDKLVKALNDIVHRDVTVEAALKTAG